MNFRSYTTYIIKPKIPRKYMEAKGKMDVCRLLEMPVNVLYKILLVSRFHNKVYMKFSNLGRFLTKIKIDKP